MSSIRSLLAANPEFRRLFLATVISLAGDWFSFVAVADLVTRLTGSAGAPAFVYAATVLPMFIVSPIAGSIADRYDRRTILVVADLVRVPLALGLIGAAALGSVELAIALVVALGVASSFHDPVTNAATPNLVRRSDLARAQALMGAVWGSMLLVGAGLGGIVAEVFGSATAFAIDATTFAISAWLVRSIRAPMQEPRSGEAPEGHGFVAGLRYVRSDPVVARLVLAKVGVSSANGTVGLLPVFAGRLAGTTLASGLMFAARGLGALLGPILARALTGATPSVRAVVVICGASSVLYAALYAALPLVSSFALALVLVVLAHVGGGAQWASSTYGLQVATPDRLRGRVLAFDYGLATLAIGMSAVLAGLLANSIGPDRTTWAIAGFGAMYGVVWTAWALGARNRGTGS